MRDELIRTYEIESHAINNAWRTIDMDEFEQACNLLLQAPRIAASGCGHSGFACMHFVHLMCCIERPARYLYPSEAVHGGLGFLHGGDVILLLSRGGTSSEIVAIADACRKKSVSVIAVTENTTSPLAKYADVVLKLHVTREVDKFNMQGTTSFAVSNVLFDAMQNALIERVGFTTAQYALDHPGGEVGKKLQETLLFRDPTD